MRRTVLLLSFALVLAACAPTADDQLVTGPPTAEENGTTAPGGSPDGGETGSPGGGTPTGEGGTTGEATEGSGGSGDSGEGGGEGPPPAEVSDLGGVGANGRAYLRPDHPAMIVEIDVQDGVSPDGAAVDHLVATIRQYAAKPEGVALSGGNGFSSDRGQWSRDDLRAAAEANRNHYSDDTTVVLYVLYVRGGFYQDGQETQAIGVAYNGSEMALFPDRWAGLGSLVGADRGIERAVLVHEFGHLLGLVNLTYQSEIDHEDPDHPGHSANKGSVMYYAVESTLIGQVFDGPPPDEFDDADRADIEGLKSGKY